MTPFVVRHSGLVSAQITVAMQISEQPKEH